MKTLPLGANALGLRHASPIAIILLAALLCLAVPSSADEETALVPPPEPAVTPEIARPVELDTDATGIDDRFEAQLHSLRAILQATANAAERQSTQQKLSQAMPVELIFSRQITQGQIDAFAAFGGTIEHIYKAVSYGWKGTIPLGAIEQLPQHMGPSLVAVIGDTEAQLCMDQATRTGRVRPVWTANFAGSPAGFTGNATTTIGIIDGGVDDSHTDLSGRRQFWKDYTSDEEANPRDVIGHGTHVTGIACGTGAAMAKTTTLNYTESGDLTAFPAYTFIPSMIHIPAASGVTFTSQATWQGGGETYLFGFSEDDSGGVLIPFDEVLLGASPLTLTNTITAVNGQHYMAALPQNVPEDVGKYAIVNTVSPYAAVGDGFNTLSGVAPTCRWAGAKVFTNAGAGGALDIGEAIDDLVARRVADSIKVVNMSLGMIGDPGLNTSIRSKVNSAVGNGMVMVVAAGNDGPGSESASQIDDPGRAARAITVAASNDVNRLTSYTSVGFLSPEDTEDVKPDLTAPGGSQYYSMILAPDSNDADADDAVFGDRRANDYANLNGTSMAAPFVTGAAALVIQAMERAGTAWDFNSSTLPLLVKMILCATATETNASREAGSPSPTLGRAAAPKDTSEGYGLLNTDAAIEAITLPYSTATITGESGGGYYDRRAWARRANIANGMPLYLTLVVPPQADYDLYVYSSSPDSKGNPVLLASSCRPNKGATESIQYTCTYDGIAYVVVKRVSGNGQWSLTGDTQAPAFQNVVAQPNLARQGIQVSIRFTASEALQGTPAVMVNSRTATLAQKTGNDYTFIYTILSSDPDGPATIAITGKDVAGISGSVTVNDALAIDKTPPVTAAVPPGGVFETEQSVALNVNEPAAIYYTTDGSTPTVASTAYAGPIDIERSTVLRFFAVDTAGNAEGVKAEVYVIGSDFTSVEADPSIARLGAEVTINFAMSSALAANPEVTVNGRDAAFAGKTGLNYTYTYTIQPEDEDGPATVTLTGTNLTGIEHTETHLDVLTVDKTAPEVGSLDGPTPTLTNSGPAVYTVMFSEDVTGLDSPGDIKITRTGSCAVGSVTVTGESGSPGPYVITLSNLTGSGAVSLSVNAGACQDLAGNDSVGSEDSAVLAVDNSQPVVVVRTPSISSVFWTNVEAHTITGTATDNVGVTTVSWSNAATGESGACTGAASWSVADVTLASGRNAITVTALDAVGNSHSDTITIVRIERLYVTPSYAGIVKGAQQQFQVFGVDARGADVPVDVPTAWSAVAGAITSGGLLTADDTEGSFVGGVVASLPGGLSASADLVLFSPRTQAGYALERMWSGPFLRPMGITLGPGDSVTVADTLGSRVGSFDTSAAYQRGWGGYGAVQGRFNWPYDAQTRGAAEGGVYVADTKNNRVQKFSPSGEFLLEWGSYGTQLGNFRSPHGLAVDAGGYVYVADSGNNRIQKFTSDGEFVTSWGAYGTGASQFDYPCDVAVDVNSDVYVADTLNHRVQKFDTSGGYLLEWGGYGSGSGQFHRTSGIAVDANGIVLVADMFNSRIQRFGSTGRYISQWGGYGSGPGMFDRPSALTVDTSGTVYVVDTYNDRVQKFVQVGAPNVTITSPTAAEGYSTNQPVVVLSGTASGYVTSLSWVNDRGGAGDCSGTTAWSTGEIALADGTNVITISAVDASGGVGSDTLTVVYYPPTAHTTTITAGPGLNPATVDSQGTTACTVSSLDSQGHELLYTWSDGGAGGVFEFAGGPGEHAATPTYTAPANATDEDVSVTITCTAACSDDPMISDTESVGLLVRRQHKITITGGPTVDPMVVEYGASAQCAITAVDSYGDVVTYLWSDGEAGGVFSPSATVRNPDYIAPAAGEGELVVSLACTVTCSQVASIASSGSTLLTVKDLPPTVEITAPTAGTQCARNCASLSIGGTASGDTASVSWSNLTTGESGACAGSTVWAADGITLEPGANTITVTAQDGTGTTATDTVVATYVDVLPGDAWRGMAMVSLPIIPDLSDPKLVVGFYGTSWTSFSPVTGAYSRYPSQQTWFEPREQTPGRGFWAFFDTDEAHPCGTIPIQSGPAVIHLKPGWNLIGQPFIASVTWDISAVMVQVGSDDPVPLSDAANIAAGYLWGWRPNADNPSTGAYYLVSDSSVVPDAVGELAPWQAYWIRAAVECDLIIPSP